MTLRLTRFGSRFRSKVLAQLLSNNSGVPLAQYLRDGAPFYAPRTSSITQTRGSGTPTITRATTATVMGYAPAAVLADGQTLLTVASGELRFQGARRISEGVWSTVDANGVPIPAATLDGSVVEAAATQYLGVTGTPATQTTASLGTGTYTLWCEGTGSCIASAGTATITGAAAASAGAPDQFEVTVAGTVTVTVTGSLTTFNLTNTPYQTSYIANAGAAGTSVTRNKDVLDDQVSGNLTAAAGSVAFQFTPLHAPSGTIALGGSYVDANNYTQILHDATNLILRKRIGGVNKDATIALAFASGTTYKIAVRWGAGGIQVAVNGVLGTADADATAAQLGTRWQWGSDGNGGQQAGAAFKEKRLWTKSLNDIDLQVITR